jgi:hypothetical protein
LISVKIVRTSVVLAMIMSFMTTALSYPFEDVPAQGRIFSEADMELLPEPLPQDRVGTAGPLPEYEAVGDGRPPGGPFRADGVALKRGETYFLQIWLIDAKHIPPALARDLLRENRSLDEIREEISKAEGSTTTRGGMILGDNRYILVNINQTFDGNCSVLDADLAKFRPVPEGAEDQTMGHITIKTCEQSGVQVGEGNLTLNDDDLSTSYRLTFLPTQPETDQNGQPAEIPGGNPWP